MLNSIKNLIMDIFIVASLKLYLVLSNEKTAASVIREMNALGKLTQEQQKKFRQPHFNVSELVSTYKSMSPKQRLNMCMTMFPEAFKESIGKGKNKRHNPNYLGRNFTEKELEKYLSKPDLPTVLQQVEGLEKGTENLAKIHNFTFQNPKNDRQIRTDTAQYINDIFDDNPYCAVHIPENSTIDRTKQLLNEINYKQKIQNIPNIDPNKNFNEVAHKINLGGKPGKTYIKAPAKNCISDNEIEELNSDFNKNLYHLITKELSYYNIPTDKLLEASKLIEALGLDKTNKTTYMEVPLQRIFNAIISRHEAMEALVNNRNIRKAPKGKLYIQGKLGDADFTSHNGPEVIADEIMNINSIFGHPANSDLFKLIRAYESIASPSYKELGYNYTDTRAPSIIANSRREAITKARNYTNKQILPYTEISSNDISDFIDLQNGLYKSTKYRLDPSIKDNINNKYWSSHPARIDNMAEKGKSFMREIFESYLK